MASLTAPRMAGSSAAVIKRAPCAMARHRAPRRARVVAVRAAAATEEDLGFKKMRDGVKVCRAGQRSGAASRV